MNIVTKFIDPTLLSMSSVREITKNERWYHYINYEGKRHLYIQTAPFVTMAPYKSKHRPGSLQLPIPLEVLSEVMKVDKFVHQRIQLPANAPSAWQKTVAQGGEFYRSIDATNDLYYMTIDPGAPVFNARRERQTNVELAEGEYQCLIHARGVYIGAHGCVPKFASLQLRVIQVIFTPQLERTNVCLFLPASDEDEQEEREEEFVIRPQQLLTDTLMDELLTVIDDGELGQQQQPETTSMGCMPAVESITPPSTIPPPLPSEPVVETVTASMTGLPLSQQTITSSSACAATPKRSSFRKRKPTLPPLTIPSSTPAKRTPAEIEARSRDLMRQYMRRDYPTQDATEEELQERRETLSQISAELVTLLGKNWEAQYYMEFQNQEREAERLS